MTPRRGSITFLTRCFFYIRLEISGVSKDHIENPVDLNSLVILSIILNSSASVIFY